MPGKNASQNVIIVCLSVILVLLFITGALVISQPLRHPSSPLQKGDIGVIHIDRNVFLDEDTGSEISRMLSYAISESSIKAVVLEINSPGGSAYYSEELYMMVLDLKKEKPVVASIGGTGASGSYLISSASNFIYAKPSSFVGAIGVVSRLPSEVSLDERGIFTGPFKESGGSRRDYIQKIDLIMEGLLNEVILQRGERLKIDKTELSKARIYTGTQALQLGFIDEIGTTEHAFEKAASLAGIDDYDIVNINENLGVDFDEIGLFLNSSFIEETNTVPSVYFVYLEVED